MQYLLNKRKTAFYEQNSIYSRKNNRVPQSQVTDKFNLINDQLTSMGYQVINPTAVTDNSQTWDAAVRHDIKTMLECDEVHLLPDWQDSRGAQLERDIALRLGMQVVYH